MLYFYPIRILVDAVVAYLVPRNGKVILHLLEHAYTLWETVHVADGISGCFATFHDFHRFKRVARSIQLFLSYAPTEKIPI